MIPAEHHWIQTSLLKKDSIEGKPFLSLPSNCPMHSIYPFFLERKKMESTWHTAMQCTTKAGSSLGSYIYEVSVGPAKPNVLPHHLTSSAMAAWAACFSRHKTYLSLTYLWVEAMCGQLLESGEDKVYGSFSCSKSSCDGAQPGQDLLLLVRMWRTWRNT